MDIKGARLRPRGLSRDIYIGAFLISVVVFLAGVFVGVMIDRQITGGLNEDVLELKSKIYGAEMFSLMENSPDFCPLYLSELKSINSEMEKVGYKLTYLEDVKNVFDPELKNNYFFLEAQSYFMAERVNNICTGRNETEENKTDIKRINTIVYFYNNAGECDRCKEQGDEILKFRDDVRENLGDNIVIYSFDGGMNSSIVEVMKNRFNVSSYPTIVLNDEKIVGFKNSQQLYNLYLSIKRKAEEG